MNPRLVRLGCQTAAVFVLILLVLAILLAPKHPVALIRVVDAAGKPVAGVVITPDGLRTKSGPYSSGHYPWRREPDWPVNDPVSTDADGYARVSYPRYVFERIETGQLSLSVRHPDFVPDRPFRTVATGPPAGAPWREWADYLGSRIRFKAFVSRPDPVVLQKGAILHLSVRPGSATSKDAPLFAQVSGQVSEESSFWIRPKPGVVATRQLRPGPQKVRAVQFDSSGWAWFSDVIGITAVAGQTNEVMTDLRRGVAVHGQLDGTVPRPIDNGRVVAHVWPLGGEPRDSPPQWHAWTAIHSDGTFDIGPLPAGELEIVALCNGFVSTNGPGQFQRLRYPQKHELGTNDINITMGMEPTACLEVQVLDDKGKALKDAQVSAWPNVRYGEWAATILTGDCYNMADRIRDGPDAKPSAWWQTVPDFNATSDGSGLAVLRNLPVEVSEFGVEHPGFALPAVVTPGGDKRRQAAVTLHASQTNRVVIRLEPRDKSPIKPADVGLVRELEPLDLERIRQLDARGWYDFLFHKYFRWKYTAPNRLATTRRSLSKYVESGTIDDLHSIKERVFSFPQQDIEQGLRIASSIRGLGIAGASGLLTLMYPEYFGTVDQFVVKALREVEGMPQRAALERMNPEGLKILDGVVLIQIMRDKAAENNRTFKTDAWTPKKIDEILWTYGR